MIVNLSLDQIRTVDQMRAFVEGADRVEITHFDRDGAYALIAVAVERVLYPRLGRADKGTVLRFLEKATGLSRAQIDRLVRQHRRTGHIRDHRNKPPARPFPRRYTPADIALLAEVDEACGQLSGPATKEILRRMHELHGDERFRRLGSISNGHIYNLRKTRSYRRGRLTFHQTRSTPVRIGQRRKPTPDGSPGPLRVDTVHLGDREGHKGICIINVVDEMTQFQHLGAVPNITEHFLIPLLEALIAAFPFTIEALHTDNGSEYVNHRVVELLNKLRIGTFTKSRPRRTNDNALVESRNGSIVRKWLGHTCVPRPLAPRVDAFLRGTLSPFLNFHRPCLFSLDVTSATGRVKKRYPQAQVATPYDRLRSLPGAEGFLRPGVTFEALDPLALATTGFEAAQGVQRARDELMRTLANQARGSAA